MSGKLLNIKAGPREPLGFQYLAEYQISECSLIKFFGIFFIMKRDVACKDLEKESVFLGFQQRSSFWVQFHLSVFCMIGLIKPFKA